MDEIYVLLHTVADLRGEGRDPLMSMGLFADLTDAVTAGEELVQKWTADDPDVEWEINEIDGTYAWELVNPHNERHYIDVSLRKITPAT